MSSLNEIATDQLGNRMVMRGGGGEASLRLPPSFMQQASEAEFINVQFG
jgi:hypothetical protein